MGGKAARGGNGPARREMVTDVEDYFSKGCGRCDRFATADCSSQRWGRGIATLRSICVDVGLQETAKWGHPCYMHAGTNIAIIGAFRDDFRLSFFQASLLKDPEGVLEKQGENTQHADMIRFTREEAVREQEKVIRTYLQEAASYAKAGIKPRKKTPPLELPAELISALQTDSELSAAFSKLTPGRKRSYVIHLGSAKKSETRVARIAKCRPKILAGKGATER